MRQYLFGLTPEQYASMLEAQETAARYAEPIPLASDVSAVPDATDPELAAASDEPAVQVIG